MSIPPARQQSPDFLGLPLVIEPSRSQIPGDAGWLPIRQFYEGIGLTEAFASVLDASRAPDLIDHTRAAMVRARVYGILVDHQDPNDHDTLRSDAVFKLVAERSPDDTGLASQPTLSRIDNAISIKSLKRLRDLFLDRFIAYLDPLMVRPEGFAVSASVQRSAAWNCRCRGNPRRRQMCARSQWW